MKRLIIGAAVIGIFMIGFAGPTWAGTKTFRNLKVLEEAAAFALQCASDWGTVSRVRVKTATIKDDWIITFSGNYVIAALGQKNVGTFNADGLYVKKDTGNEVHMRALRWFEPTGTGAVHGPPVDSCLPGPTSVD